MSPRFKARIAGFTYVFSVLTAVFGEFVLRGKVSYALGLFAVACYVVVTLLLYDLFSPVNGKIAVLALAFGIAGLALEAIRLQPWGMNLAMVFHGFYCLLFGYLFLRSTFLPRLLGALMAIAGLLWLTNLSTPLANFLFRYITVIGLFGEGLPMLWLLIFGVNTSDWEAKAST